MKGSHVAGLALFACLVAFVGGVVVGFALTEPEPHKSLPAAASHPAAPAAVTAILEKSDETLEGAPPAEGVSSETAPEAEAVPHAGRSRGGDPRGVHALPGKRGECVEHHRGTLREGHKRQGQPSGTFVTGLTEGQKGEYAKLCEWRNEEMRRQLQEIHPGEEYRAFGEIFRLDIALNEDMIERLRGILTPEQYEEYLLFVRN